MHRETGQPDNYQMDGSEAPNEGGVTGDEDAVELDCRPIDGDGTAGRWNDNIEAGNNHAGRITGMYPLCETVAYARTETLTYVGCFKDEGDADGDGTIDCAQEGSAAQQPTTIYNPDGTDAGVTSVGRCRDLNGAFFSMGDNSGKDICSELCAGYVYFGIQNANECYCDNAPTAAERAPEGECNRPCYTGANDDSSPIESATEMCGGAWRNSVYQASSTWWENPGYDDRGWQAAADLGVNGVAPWFKRPQINDAARWIWTTDPGENGGYTNAHAGNDAGGSVTGSGEGHGNIFCRYTAANADIVCPAAQAQYWENNPDVKTAEYPAFLHYTEFGKKEGRVWPSELCNTCSELTSKPQDGVGPQGAAGVSTDCDASVFGNRVGDCFERPGVTGDNAGAVGEYNGGGTGHAQNQYTDGRTQSGGTYTYEEGLQCTNKCRGKHDGAVATLTGAQSCHQPGDVCHGGHYGLGFVNFLEASGGTASFDLHACNAGRHRVAIDYALAAAPSRPLSVTVNGQVVTASLAFPATGSWTIWGQVFTEVMLLDGENTLVLTTLGAEGPNLDAIEVYPVGDDELGTAFVEVDNSHTTYVNGRQIGVGNGWDTTDVFTFQASCDTPTVYAIHGVDAELTAGVSGAGMIAEFNHCGEVIRTNSKWKCWASDAIHSSMPPADWMAATTDDSTWASATSYGKNGNADNYWYAAMGRAADEIGPDATWIWTSDGHEDMQHPGSSHNDVYCRYVSDHKGVNCKAAADRYWADYGTGGCHDVQGNLGDCDAWAHFQETGKFMGRIWHSEICDENCGFRSSPFDWIDASIGGTALTFENTDDGSVAVELPFPFPFYGQVKTQAIISTNGFLTFSGDHHASHEGLGPHGGETRPIPNSNVPNDLVR